MPINTPSDLSDTQINRLVETGELPTVDRITETVREINPELLFLSTKKRHRPDIYECRACGYQFPAEVSCPECESKNVGVFMRAPSSAEVRNRSSEHRDIEAELTEIDPDWREHFSDQDVAASFYGLVRYVCGSQR